MEKIKKTTDSSRFRKLVVYFIWHEEEIQIDDAGETYAALATMGSKACGKN